MKILHATATVAALGVMSVSGAKVRRANYSLDNEGAPVGASHWDGVPQSWFKNHPAFQSYNQPGTQISEQDIDANGQYTYPDGGGYGGQYLAYLCAKEAPGMYWAEYKDSNGNLGGESGFFWQLKDGSYAWTWSANDGTYGINTAAKGTIDSKCGYKKA